MQPTRSTTLHAIWLAILIAATVGFRAGYFAFNYESHSLWQPANIQQNGWIDIAENIKEGHGYSLNRLLTYFPQGRYQPTAARGPIPVFVFYSLIHLFGPEWYHPVIVFSWICSAFVACSVYGVAYLATDSRKLSIIASFVFAIYMSESYIATAYSTRSEPIFSLLFSAYFLTLAFSVKQKKTVWLIASSGFLGLACLARPTVLLLPFVTCLILMTTMHRRRLGAMALFCAILGLIQIPWVVRNYYTFGRVVVASTLGGYNLYRHNSMIADGKYMWAVEHDEVAANTQEMVEASGSSMETIDEVELDAVLTKEATSIILEHPFGYARMCAQRLIWIWYKQNSGKGMRAVQNAIIYLLLIPGSIAAVRNRNVVGVTILAHLFYFVSIHSLINAQYRFICPMMGFVIILAVSGGNILVGHRKTSRSAAPPNSSPVRSDNSLASS